MQRRDFIRNASLALAAFGLPSLPACAASRSGQMGLRRLGQRLGVDPGQRGVERGRQPRQIDARVEVDQRAPDRHEALLEDLRERFGVVAVPSDSQSTAA